jgi:hypothetical protein
MSDQKIYPDLPDIHETVDPQNFRLTQITEIKKFLEEEIEFRRKIFSKYEKAFDIMTGFSHFLNFTSVLAGSVGVSALAAVITAPVGLALGGVTIGSACLSSLLGWQKKTAVTKLEKQSETRNKGKVIRILMLNNLRRLF